MVGSKCPGTITSPLRDEHNGIAIVLGVGLEMGRMATSGMQSAMTTQDVAPVRGCSAQLGQVAPMSFSHMTALIPEDRHQRS